MSEDTGITFINTLLGKVRKGRAIGQEAIREQKEYDQDLQRRIKERYLFGNIDREIKNRNLAEDSTYDAQKQGETKGIYNKLYGKRDIYMGVQDDVYKAIIGNDAIYTDVNGKKVSGNQIINRENLLNELDQFKQGTDLRVLQRSEDIMNKEDDYKIKLGLELGLDANTAMGMSLTELTRRFKNMVRVDKANTDVYVKKQEAKFNKESEIEATSNRLENIIEMLSPDRDENIDISDIVVNNELETATLISGYNDDKIIIPLNEEQVKETNLYLPPQQRINKNLPYAIIDSVNDADYKKLTNNEDRFFYGLGIVNDNVSISNFVYKNLPQQEKSILDGNIRTALFAMFQNRQVEGITVEGDKLVVQPQRINIKWKNIGFNWTNLPEWVKTQVKTALKIKGDVGVGERRKYALVDNNQIEDNKLKTQSTIVDVTVDQEVIDSVYRSTVEGPNQTITQEKFIKDAIFYHAASTGNSISEYMVNQNMSELGKEGAQQLVNEAIANAKARPDEMIISNFLRPLYYDDSLQPRTSPLGKRKTPEFVMKASLYAYESSLGTDSQMVSDYMSSMGYTGNFTNVASSLQIDGASYFNSLIIGLAESIRKGDKPPTETSGPMAGESAASSIFVDYSTEMNVNQYRESIGIDINAANAAKDFAAKGITVIDQLTLSLNDTNVGSALVENLAKFVDGLGTLPGQLANAFGLDSNATLAQTVTAIKEQLATGVNHLDERVELVNGQLSDPFLRKLVSGLEDSRYRDGENIGKALRGEQGSKIARQQALHSMAVYFIAAALQGEGGKAISDADREFVQWALSYRTFSNPAQRKEALAGIKFILSKVYAQNTAAASDDIRLVWASREMDRVFGKVAMNPAHYPPGIIKNYKKAMAVADRNRPEEIFTSNHTNTMNRSELEPFKNLDVPESPTRVIGLQTKTSRGYGVGNEVFNIDIGTDRNNNLVSEEAKNAFVNKYKNNMSELTTIYNLLNEENKIKFINHLTGAGLTDFVNQLQNEQGAN